MWLFLSDAFVSIVAVKGSKTDLMVRARVAGDLEKLFPSADVTRTPDADYLYRTVVSRALVKKALAYEVDLIDYPNFKDSVSKKEKDRSGAYSRVWQAMMDLQEKKEGAGKYTRAAWYDDPSYVSQSEKDYFNGR